MKIWRNVSAFVLASLLLVAGAPGLHASWNCTVDEGYGTATVTGTCQESCGEALGWCSDYCYWDYGSYPEHLDCTEILEPPWDVDFTCYCGPIFED